MQLLIIQYLIIKRKERASSYQDHRRYGRGGKYHNFYYHIIESEVYVWLKSKKAESNSQAAGDFCVLYSVWRWAPEISDDSRAKLPPTTAELLSLSASWHSLSGPSRSSAPSPSSERRPAWRTPGLLKRFWERNMPGSARFARWYASCSDATTSSSSAGYQSIWS